LSIANGRIAGLKNGINNVALTIMKSPKSRLVVFATSDGTGQVSYEFTERRLVRNVALDGKRTSRNLKLVNDAPLYEVSIRITGKEVELLASDGTVLDTARIESVNFLAGTIALAGNGLFKVRTTP